MSYGSNNRIILPDITLRERGTPAEQYRQAVAQRKGSADGA